MNVLRVANCSGFYGDRLSAAREMVDGGPVDVLTGDWLAELTMGILGRQRLKDPDAGYARTFVTQLEDVLGDCLSRGIKIVSNAGGLNPAACAARVSAIGERLGRPVRVAVVTGDDAASAFRAHRASGWAAPHLDTGSPMPGEPLVVNAYLGAWGIAAALAAGADVVVTGRVTDASLVVGPAIWAHGWGPHDLDRLAGAVVAGHVVECGAQCCGGNYAFFEEVPGLDHVGFPLVEVAADGSSVVTKHPGTGGAVTVGTVTAQLLYEIGGPRYLSPDAVARFDTVALDQVGPDRVRISGVRGEPPPPALKVAANVAAGWRNAVTFVLTGAQVEAKARAAEAAVRAELPGGGAAFDEWSAELSGDRSGGGVATLRLAVRGGDPVAVGRAFSQAAVGTSLATYPGAFTTAAPTGAQEVARFWPIAVDAGRVVPEVLLDGAPVGPLPAWWAGAAPAAA
ncbi:MAG: acyclic terpene utilization AtuA family protein, partial [Acidimicrobiales bacterium]